MLSGEQPWSELGEDVAVILRLSKGDTPGRPNSRLIDEQHWKLIEHCLSTNKNRPAAGMIMSSIMQFLERFPSSRPLREVIPLLPRQNSQQPNSTYPSSSTSLAGRGNEVTSGAIGPNHHGQHISK